jgi:hypothetical protein
MVLKDELTDINSSAITNSSSSNASFALLEKPKE